MKVRGIILDIDGTLVDSNDQHAQAWVETLREAEREIAFEGVRPLIGMGSDRLLPALTGLRKEEPEGERLSSRAGTIFRERHLSSVRPFPRVRELLERMCAASMTLVVATSASREDMRALIELAGIADLMQDATSASDADESKPAPDIVEAAVEKSGHPPTALVMLGDTPYDIAAARRAGVPVIALRCGGWWSDEALESALAIYDDPAALLAEWERSPLATRG